MVLKSPHPLVTKHSSPGPVTWPCHLPEDKVRNRKSPEEDPGQQGLQSWAVWVLIIALQFTSSVATNRSPNIFGTFCWSYRFNKSFVFQAQSCLGLRLWEI